MKRKYLELTVISALIVCIDQVTKLYIHTQFRLGETLPLIRDYFHFTYVRNYGAAFGFLQESHPQFREIFFLSMPPIAMGIILLLLKSVPDEDRKQVICLSLIFGGAIGNYIDRLRFGYVIDFLDFHYKNQISWPAFNVADSTIVVGVILLLWLTYKESQSKKSP